MIGVVKNTFLANKYPNFYNNRNIFLISGFLRSLSGPSRLLCLSHHDNVSRLKGILKLPLLSGNKMEKCAI